MKSGSAGSSRRSLMLLLVLLGLAAWSFWPERKPAGPEAGIGAKTEGEEAPRRRSGGKKVLSPSDVPDLDIEVARGPAPEKVQRNVFRFYDKPTPVPTPIPPPPTPIPRMGERDFIGPVPIPPTPTPTPIVAPAIPYRLVGIFGPREEPIAALEEGTRLLNARQGEILDSRFKVLRINRESVDFQFVNLPPEITRRLPISSAEPVP